MGGRDHSCPDCGHGGFNDPDGVCICAATASTERRIDRMDKPKIVVPQVFSYLDFFPSMPMRAAEALAESLNGLQAQIASQAETLLKEMQAAACLSDD